MGTSINSKNEAMSMASDEESELNLRDIIERIRRYEFGIGADLHGDGEVVVGALVRKYRNLLETVAKDLNSKESHFLLELVQNADDDEYAPDVAPALSFRLTSEELVVSNNELGFVEKNVRALCSAGESSKKNKVGYIGEKGIGFKSVFKVTDTPEIHSNGYHFRFDLTDPEDSLGYVVPHWIPARDDALVGQTTVVLPARPGHAFAASLLDDINSTLLLFLGKLRQVELHREGTSERFEREDIGALSTLTLSTKGPDGTETIEFSRYLRSKLSLDMSGIAEPKREKIETAEIVLAFPMSAEGAAEPVKGCQTYAFLPVREFGFTFYIQADFVLISSREGIHEELFWNLRLRDAIASAFAAAVEQFKAHPKLATTYLRFLPGKGEIVDPFFAPVVDQMIEALKAVPCIPVEGGGWRKPAEVLLASAAVRKLFGSTDAVTLFRGDYPIPGLAMPDGGLERLSCRALLPEEVLGVFSQHSEWLRAKDLDWKVRFYEYLSKSPRRDDFVSGMLELPCIPTADGGMANPEDGPIFYPLSSGPTYGFEHMLTVVDQAFYTRARELAPEVLVLLSDLGVKRDEPYELIKEHIIPHHTTEGFKAADRPSLIGHIRYLRDKLDVYLARARERGLESQALQELREGLYLASKKEENDTLFFERPDSLYLSKAYRPDFDIETLLGDTLAPEKLLSDQYIVKGASKGDKDFEAEDLERWRDLFVKVGVHQSPKIIRQVSGDIACTMELTALLRSDVQALRRATLESLSRHWGLYSGLTTYYAKSGRSVQHQRTQFGTALRRTVAPTRRRVSVSLEQTFHDRLEIRELLGGNLVFVDADLFDEQFLAACGITFKINVEACLKRLRQLRAEGRVSREQIRPIYRQLERLWANDRSTIEAAFKTEALIAVGRGESTTWVLPSDACWRPSNIRLLDSRHPPLGNQYVDFSNFFTNLLNVPLELALEKWMDALADLGSIESKNEREITALAIYRRLSQRIGALAAANPPVSLPGWVARLKREVLFLTQRGDVMASSPSLYFNDAPEYAALFKDVPEATFLAAAPEQLSAILQLLNKAEIRTLTTALKVEVAADIKGKRDEQLMHKLRSMFMCIARIVYGQSLDRFDTAIKDKLFEALRDLEILIVPGLALDVTLGAVRRRTTGAVARRGSQLLLDADAPSHLDQVALEIRKLLRLPAVLADIISRVLISPTLGDAEAYLQLRQISALPPEEALSLSRALGLEPPEPEPVFPPLQPAGSPELPREPDSAATPAPAPDVLAATSVGPPPAAGAATVPVALSPLQINEGTNPSGDEAGKQSASDTVRPGWLGRDSPTAPSRSGIPAWSPAMTFPTAGPPDTPETQRESEKLPNASDAWTAGTSGGSVSGLHGDSSLPAGVFAPTRIGWASNGGYSSQRHRTRTSGRARTRQRRLLSYADTTDPGNPRVPPSPEADLLAAARNRVIELAAVQHFLDKAAPQWKSLEVMPPGNPGYDIKAVAMDGREEFIEVKGQGAAWSEEGVALTPTELVKAHSARDRYWLCVVEYANDENRRQLYLVQDPFGLTTQFRFDKGWKAVAKIIVTRPRKPEVGMFVEIPNEGKGRIARVKGTGQFSKLHVEFEDGSKSFSKVFNPVTMTLSYD